jgi:hypothetical protein
MPSALRGSRLVTLIAWLAVPACTSSRTSATRPPTAAPRAASAIPPEGLGAWTGHDDVPPSVEPPGHLAPARVPMFVAFGFDDNPFVEGMEWAIATFARLTNPPGTGQAGSFDGTPAGVTFYHSAVYADVAGGAWRQAFAAGFEAGNHTTGHLHGGEFTQAQWRTELEGCLALLTRQAPPGVGMRREQIYGFRTPFLEYDGDAFPVIKQLGFRYDCSIEEGYEPSQDGTRFFWPYTLDRGSPGHEAQVRPPPLVSLKPIATWPAGLWEMPVYTVIAPPDAEAARYGVPPGLRAKFAKLHPDYLGASTGKMTGMDWNLWYDYGTTKAEFVAIWKYTLDQRRRGNRAPFLWGGHTAIYDPHGEAVPSATLAERRAAVEEVLAYAIGLPEVRVVSTRQVLDWMRNPVPLD